MKPDGECIRPMWLSQSAKKRFEISAYGIVFGTFCQLIFSSWLGIGVLVEDVRNDGNVAVSQEGADDLPSADGRFIERAEALENLGLAHRRPQKLELFDDFQMASLREIHSWKIRFA